MRHPLTATNLVIGLVASVAARSHPKRIVSRSPTEVTAATELEIQNRDSQKEGKDETSLSDDAGKLASAEIALAGDENKNPANPALKEVDQRTVIEDDINTANDRIAIRQDKFHKNQDALVRLRDGTPEYAAAKDENALLPLELDVLHAKVTWYRGQRDVIDTTALLRHAGGEAARTGSSDAAVVFVARAKEASQKNKLALDQATEAWTRASSLLTTDATVKAAEMKEVAVEKEEIKADGDNEKSDAAALAASSGKQLSDAVRSDPSATASDDAAALVHEDQSNVASAQKALDANTKAIADQTGVLNAVDKTAANTAYSATTAQAISDLFAALSANGTQTLATAQADLTAAIALKANPDSSAAADIFKVKGKPGVVSLADTIQAGGDVLVHTQALIDELNGAHTETDIEHMDPNAAAKAAVQATVAEAGAKVEAVKDAANVPATPAADLQAAAAAAAQ